MKQFPILFSIAFDNDNMKKPDFKVCTQNYAVETLPKWWSVGHTDEWAYKTQEEEADESV